MDFVKTEMEAAEEIGVSRDAVKEIRGKLERGKDWDIVTGFVRFTREGMHALIDLVMGKKTELPERTIKGLLEPHREEPKLEVTMIVKRFFKNPRILGCVIKGNEAAGMMRVQVQSTKNFVLRMEIPARWVKADLWELTRKCPRYRGRW